ncbi:hypothetical protein EKO23_01950 [Nocardioides guangzhouensis]|uniref:Uncharacterized protein n=1 Tax=Nocardioides guangzhouensis TaxID=2497878 RepID=A0A4Q4ZL62_9ACTN|nr:hypothetical protein [Nocardioides guangzhouensis]RYP88675.1 hypothetical protein EKO23_01950 [Nocardioides guangzhouensis]
MFDGAIASTWGDWVLGDLADALNRASVAVGPGTQVESVGIAPPSEESGVPTVSVLMTDVLAIRRIGSEIVGLYDVELGPAPVPDSWAGVLLGVHLVLTPDLGEPT